MDTQTHGIQLRKRHWSRASLIIVTVSVAGLVVGISLGWFLARQSQMLPDEITKQLKFSVHLPTELPPGYTVDTKSAMIDKGVLVLYFTNAAGYQIVFTEQARPTNQNFDNFYMQNIANAERLENVVNESVLGDLPSGGYMLSVLTDSTWLLISTTAPNGKAALRFIAEYVPR